MKVYLLSVLTTSLIASLVGILTPEGERGGIAKHVKLLLSLLLICALIAPLKGAVQWLRELGEGEIRIPAIEDSEHEYQSQMQEALDGASETYFIQMLTQAIASEFSISTDQMRCSARWEQAESGLAPTSVTVILSGAAIWKNPHAIEAYVVDLLGCACEVAIE